MSFLLRDPCVTNSLDTYAPLSALSSPRSVTPTTPKFPPPRGVSHPPLQPPRSVHKGCCYCRRKGCSARKYAPVSTRALALLPPLATQPGPTWSQPPGKKAVAWRHPGFSWVLRRTPKSLHSQDLLFLSPHPVSQTLPPLTRLSWVGFPRVGLETGKGGRGCMSTIICFTAMCQGLIQGKVPPILLPSCRACCLMPCAPLRPPPLGQITHSLETVAQWLSSVSLWCWVGSRGSSWLGSSGWVGKMLSFSVTEGAIGYRSQN